MAAAQTIRNKKVALRKVIKQRLLGLSAEEKRVQSEYVAKKLLSHPEYLKSQRISIYLSTENEINTISILEDIFRTGKKCFIPQYVPGNRRMTMVSLKSMQDYHSLPVNSWNIRTPTDTDREMAMDTVLVTFTNFIPTMYCVMEDSIGYTENIYGYYINMDVHKIIGGVDLIVVPCCAITVQGVRLGHGKGYYDAFLTEAKATTIAPVFREQIENDIPTEDHDVPIDYVLYMPRE